MHIRKHSVSIDASTAPVEFRLFARGVNRTSKGDVIFDAEAAASVMAAYEKHGVDLMIDLDHASLDAPTRADSGDARGWFKLAVRNGELWAVSVRWAPDGEARLREKKQRYISPAFVCDEKTGRVLELVNAAICARPATHNAIPLVAASLGNQTSATLAARVPLRVAQTYRATAALLGLPVGAWVRMILLASVQQKDTATIADLLAMLELPKGATLDEALERVRAVFGSEPAPSAKPAPKTPPAPSSDALGGTAATLTRAEREYIARARITLTEFQARKARAVRVTPRKGSR